MRVAAPLCCITVVVPVQVATPILDVDLKSVLADLGFRQFGLDGGFDFGVAELALAVRHGERPGAKDNEQASRQRITRALFMSIQCARRAGIRKQKKRLLDDLAQHAGRDFALRHANATPESTGASAGCLTMPPPSLVTMA